MLGSGIRQPRGSDGSVNASHPLFRPHLIQGWTPDFIPKLTEDALDLALVDRVERVSSGEAMRLCRELAQREGIFVGTSGGATFAGALAVCRSAPAGATVLCMLPDTGERYLSTPLFEEISTEMSAEEIEIAHSTPDAPAEPEPQADAAPLEPSAEAAELVRQVLADPEQPVVMFAFQWCEFCWSVRRLFKACAISYRSVDLDSAELRHDDRGGKVRAAVAARTGVATIPQVFIGGHFVGGAREVFDAFSEGRLQALLEQHRVPFEIAAGLDPKSLLPNWLQTRSESEPAACNVPRRP
jgi:cysteine synthase A